MSLSFATSPLTAWALPPDADRIDDPDQQSALGLAQRSAQGLVRRRMGMASRAIRAHEDDSLSDGGGARAGTASFVP